MDFTVGYRHLSEGEPFSALPLEYPQIAEVYFPWPEEPSGRPVLGYEEGDDSEMVRETLHAELVAIKGGGKRLDLLLNANCYGSQAMSIALEQHILEIIHTLDDWGVKPEVVTVASPFVAQVIKHNFAEIEIRASVNMRLVTLQSFRYLSPWFDSFCLGRDIQRDLKAVKGFSDWCHTHGKRLGILANSGCLRNCPWQTYHDNLVAHSNAAIKRLPVRGFNPHLCWTLYANRQHLPEILKATWVRPEDLHRYAGLVDFVKLATRQHFSPRLVVDAYVRGQYHGNLLDLLEPGFSPAFRPLVIDNAAFPPDWAERIGNCGRDCTECGYCEEVFARVGVTQGGI